METVGVRVTVHELVDGPGVAVEREDHGAIGREVVVELEAVHAVRVIVGGEQAHEVDDVHDADPQVGKVPAKQPRRGDRLLGRDVAGAGQAPRPDPCRRRSDAQSQIPNPRVQWTFAASASRYCSCGCLSITMRLT